MTPQLRAPQWRDNIERTDDAEVAAGHRRWYIAMGIIRPATPDDSAPLGGFAPGWSGGPRTASTDRAVDRWLNRNYDHAPRKRRSN